MGDWMNYFNRGMNYLKKNGVKDTFYASVERISDRDKYSFRPISFETMKKQMGRNWKKDRLFSLVVPAYETEEKYLRELIIGHFVSVEYYIITTVQIQKDFV